MVLRSDVAKLAGLTSNMCSQRWMGSLGAQGPSESPQARSVPNQRTWVLTKDHAAAKNVTCTTPKFLRLMVWKSNLAWSRPIH